VVVQIADIGVLVELPLVEKEFVTFLEHILSSPDLVVFVLLFSLMCRMLQIIVCPFVPFLLTIILFVL
jgi:hypothetical protein